MQRSAPYRVAFIESTASQTVHLRQLLEFERITVLQLTTDALHQMPELPVDLVVIDQRRLMSSAPAMAASLGRGLQPRALTLALVAQGDEVCGIELVERGLDAYMVVPCGAREFVARVRALLRRTRRLSPEAERGASMDGMARTVRIRDLQIDPSRRRVRMGDQDLRLTEQEFQLLYFLAGNPGRVFGRQALLDAVWGTDTFVTSRSVDALVKRLRQQLRAPSRGRSLVETVRGVGYRLTETALPASMSAS